MLVVYQSLRHHVLRTSSTIQIFVSITMSNRPQYYDFEVTSEVRNSNVISTIIYAAIFIAVSIKWRREIAKQEAA